MTNDPPFNPDDWLNDWISPPGDTIADVLEERGWSLRVFAEKACIPLARAERLISGDAPIDEATAATLSRVLGSTSRFWLTREAHYRTRIRQLQKTSELEQKDRPTSKGPSLG